MAKQNVYDLLEERGFIEQATHPDEIRKLLDEERVTFYIGFDPTADSLHVGHFIQIMAMMHMQRAGHRPTVLLGGGTGMVGDPSGRTDMRKVLTIEQIQHNVNSFKKQVEKFIDFEDDKALLLDNSEWLCELGYIDFLRDVGAHFSVNRMLSAECFKSRYERGLSFIEFNYMVMQSYDFLYQYRKYGCKLQLGGNDQWSNIIGGVDLVRKADQAQVYGLTLKLLTNSEGQKMGKTANGAVWLDREKMSPYDFYQYWRNINDLDVEKCLSLLTFIPMDEVKRLSNLPGEKINEAKKVLAFEVTKLVHSEADAIEAEKASEALFEGANRNDDAIPTSNIKAEDLSDKTLLQLLKDIDFIDSTSEGRRLIQQGGLRVNDVVIDDVNYQLTLDNFDENQEVIIQKGKKKFKKIKI